MAETVYICGRKEKRKMSLRGQYLDPKADLTFKRVFGEHKNLVTSLLNALLPLPEGAEIVDVEYVSPEMVPETPMKKDTIVDVRCKDDRGRYFLVEMQMYWYKAVYDRVMLNVCKMYSRQAEKAGKYRELQPVYSLNLVNDVIDQEFGDEYIHNWWMTLDGRPEMKLDALCLTFVELPKFKPSNRAEAKLRDLWLTFLTKVDDTMTEMPKGLMENEMTQEAMEIVRTSAYSEGEMLAYDKYWDEVRMEEAKLYEKYEAGREEGREVGLKEGEKKGREEGREEGIGIGERRRSQSIVQNMKRRGMTVEDIVEMTGMAEEEVRECFEE